ncbi:MAG: rhodanese-like domain-containing protein [Candidatus Pelagadaptatus aseana]|uniref:rhodanese-like domain-containing protein n=1 Tax=Candidatus Pelagadaptatus aseana TaxID=3120508 RepID=UPI0039B1FC64
MSYTTISAQEFAGLHRQDKVSLCIDVRTEGEFNGSFCDGSLNLPLHGFTLESVNDFISDKDVAEEMPVYLMCLGGKRATVAAQKLAGQLKHPVVVVEGGVSALPHDVMIQGESGVLPLDRQVRIAIGSVVLLGTVIGALVDPMGYALSAFAGAGLIFAGVTDNCLMASLVARMPWNQARS